MSMMISADVGTSRTKVAAPTRSGESQILTNRLGEMFTPSVVYFDEDRVLIGSEAENAALADPTRAVYDWKRHMGTDDVLYDDGSAQYRAPDILEILLRTIKADAEAKLGEPVGRIAMTVPANYTNAQKTQTREAAKAVGLEVVAMPHEPTAGALGNGVHKARHGKVLVVDPGAGTTDISIIEVDGNICKVTATGGIPKLGGRDFSARIEERVVEAFEAQHGYRPDGQQYPLFYQDLRVRAEQLKTTLSARSQASIVMSCSGDVLNMPVTRDEFEGWVQDLVEQITAKAQEVIQEAGLSWADIDAVYPIGGCSMVPAVVRQLEEVSGKTITKNNEAHSAAALGAVVAGRIECDRQGKPIQIGSQVLPPIKYYVMEILSCPIGVSVLNDDGNTVCSVILTKDTPVPSIKAKHFGLAELDQTNVRICVLQGADGVSAEDCLSLGHFDLHDIPVRPDVVERIEVTFDLDRNGLLTASARDTVSNKRAELTVDREDVVTNEGGKS